MTKSNNTIKPELNETELKTLLDSIKRTLGRYFGLSVGFGVCYELFFILVFFINNPKNNLVNILLYTFFGVIPVLISAWYLNKLLNYKNEPVLKTLLYAPDQIAWIYPRQINSYSYGIQVATFFHVLINTKNKKKYQLEVKERNLDPLLNLMYDLAPNAVFGFSQEIRKAYRKDSHSLSLQFNQQDSSLDVEPLIMNGYVEKK